MARKSLEELEADYKLVQECQKELREAGVSAYDSAMQATADQLGKLDKQIRQMRKAERGR